MNRVLVLYDSATGNTAKMAQFVAAGAAGIDGIEVRIRSLDEATADDVVWCDGLALGSPTNMGVMSWKMKRF
ncbi:MAG: flavodoxin domain-containing protein, partial [Pirellulaceae bacterium]|nr:flavodoxin domain-containing protein [Pirellulaceae bacterium]